MHFHNLYFHAKARSIFKEIPRKDHSDEGLGEKTILFLFLRRDFLENIDLLVCRQKILVLSIASFYIILWENVHQKIQNQVRILLSTQVR
jgi:hypothetical protein